MTLTWLLLGAPNNNADAPCNQLNGQNCPLLKIIKKIFLNWQKCTQLSNFFPLLLCPFLLRASSIAEATKVFCCVFVAFRRLGQCSNLLSLLIVYAGFRLDDLCVLLVAQGRRRRSCERAEEPSSAHSRGRRFFHMFLRKKVLPHEGNPSCGRTFFRSNMFYCILFFYFENYP